MLEPGAVFAGYRIERALGEGGMGAVYLARHPRLPREDALKILHPALSSETSYVARFEREAEVASRLSHPSLVPVYDRGMEEGHLWLSMAYVPGTDAAAELRARGPMPLHRVQNLVDQVADGLDHAHGHGLVHRDVKPDNILIAAGPVRPERILLTDFGIAAVTGRKSLTAAGSFVATIAYAPLEQLEGREVDARTDVYALGAVLYELLTGQRPFGDRGLTATYAAKVRGEIPDLAAQRPDLPPRVAAVIQRAMAPEPSARFPTCGELAAAAREVLTRSPAAPPPPPSWSPQRGPSPGPPPSYQHPPPPLSPPFLPAPPLPPPSRSRRRRGHVVAAVCGVVVLLVAGVGVLLGLRSSGPDSPRGLRAEPDAGQVTLRWEPVAEASRYEVLRNGERLAHTEQPQFVDESVEAGTRYSYAVASVDSEGDRSAEAAFGPVTAPLAAPRLEEPVVEGVSVTLVWAAVPGAERYEVARDGDTLVADLSGTTYTDADAPVGEVTYRVRAVDDDGDAGNSSAVASVEVAPWGAMQPIASHLVGLVPRTPDVALEVPVSRHYCAFDPPQELAVEEIYCVFDNGIEVYISRYRSAADVATHFGVHPALTVEDWHCFSEHMGRLREGPDPMGGPFEQITFEDAADDALTFYDLYVDWPAPRTVAELRTTFFESGILCPT